jgi:hypothetical protein
MSGLLSHHTVLYTPQSSALTILKQTHSQGLRGFMGDLLGRKSAREKTYGGSGPVLKEFMVQ